MTIYVITGEPGAGKSLVAAGIICDALVARQKVATNLDILLDKLVSGKNMTPVWRLPDFPDAADLYALGNGADTRDERHFGWIVLDELGLSMNAREWNDKKRTELIKWFLQSRKRRWNLVLIVQSEQILDKQMRLTLVEQVGRCRRLDRIRLPLIGGLLELFGFRGSLPRVHICTVRYGSGQHTLITRRWWYTGVDIYDGYDTEQKLGARDELYTGGAFFYLSSWHTAGRYALPTGWQDVWDAWTKPASPRLTAPAPRLAPLLKLPPARRWEVARQLVYSGAL